MLDLLISIFYNNNFPVFAHNIGLAGLTILIPVAIAIFTGTRDFPELDNHLVLDHVIKSKNLVLSLALIFLPVLFWQESSLCLRFIEFILWCIGIYIIYDSLRLSYLWLKGKKFKLRFDFLTKLSDKKDMEESWHSVWENDKVNSVNERDFFNIFTKKIDQLLAQKDEHDVENLDIASKLLNDFQNYMDKRSSFFISYNVLPKIFEWHIMMWRGEIEFLSKGSETLDLWSQYNQLYRQLDSIFAGITTKVLIDNTTDTYTFFDKLSKHIEKYKDEKITVEGKNDHHYSQYILRNFLAIFFEKIDLSPDKYNIWESYFPPTLKIQTSSIVSNILQQFVLGEYLQWAQNRIYRVNEKNMFDNQLDEVSEHLFPEVDPILWAEILTFVLTPYHTDERMRYIIEERPRIFGLSSRIRSFGGVIEDDKDFHKKAQDFFDASAKSENEKTIEMVLALSKIVPVFYQTFTLKNIADFINQCNSLKYDSTSKNENRRNILINFFKELSKKIKN